MPQISNGLYRIGLGDMYLTALDEILVLSPDEPDATQTWDVRRTVSGDYTLALAGTNKYAGYPRAETMSMCVLMAQPQAWGISDGAIDGTVTIAAHDPSLKLAPSLLRIYPPRVALLDGELAREYNWTLQPA